MINGFEVKKVKSMLGPDGYITSCDLYHDGKKLGEYFNDGMGGMYDFWPRENQDKIESCVKQFPQIVEGIDWDIGILVDELMNQKEILKNFRKYKKQNKTYVVVDAKKGEAFVNLNAAIENIFCMDELKLMMDVACVKRDLEFVDMHVYTTETDIDIDFGISL